MYHLVPVDGLFSKAKLGHFESCLCDQNDEYVHGVNAKVNSASLRGVGLDLFKRRRRECAEKRTSEIHLCTHTNSPAILRWSSFLVFQYQSSYHTSIRSVLKD